MPCQTKVSKKKNIYTHLFFQCCVAKNVWEIFSGLLNLKIGEDFESVASLWIANKKHIISSVILWVLWKLRNSVCFQGVLWSGMKNVFAIIGRMLRRWLAMFKLDVQEKVEMIIQQVEFEASSAPLIRWRVDTLLELAQSDVLLLEVSSNAIMNQCNRASLALFRRLFPVLALWLLCAVAT